MEQLKLTKRILHFNKSIINFRLIDWLESTKHVNWIFIGLFSLICCYRRPKININDNADCVTFFQFVFVCLQFMFGCEKDAAFARTEARITKEFLLWESSKNTCNFLYEKKKINMKINRRIRIRKEIFRTRKKTRNWILRLFKHWSYRAHERTKNWCERKN